jgi:putative hydrolase of the HAD superfamily
VGRPRGVIFDLDDTLYPREQFITSALEAVARQVAADDGLDAALALDTLLEARRRGEHGRELQALCTRHGLPHARVPALVRAMQSHPPRLRLAPAALSVLAELRAGGWRMAILTNGLPSVQRAKIAALGLAALVHHVIYAEEHSREGKPAAPGFREALRRLGVPADRCVCVGDDPARDIAGARALGIRSIRLRTAGLVVEPQGEADAVVDDLQAVPAALTAVLEAAVFHAA